MEIVILADLQPAFASNWIRIANTEGVSEIQIKDRFREQGFGPGAEELEVDGIDISPVGGFSRIFVNRGAGATKPDTHRLGAVFQLVRLAPAAEEVMPNDDDRTSGLHAEPADMTAGVTADALGWEAPAPDEISEPEAAAVSELAAETEPVNAASDDLLDTFPEPVATAVPLKRKRGRPPGVKNKPKVAAGV